MCWWSWWALPSLPVLWTHEANCLGNWWDHDGPCGTLFEIFLVDLGSTMAIGSRFAEISRKYLQIFPVKSWETQNPLVNPLRIHLSINAATELVIRSESGNSTESSTGSYTHCSQTRSVRRSESGGEASVGKSRKRYRLSGPLYSRVLIWFVNI